VRTQVAIIGGGPAGTLLSLVLRRAGISSIVLERQSRDYVLGRIRAGVLEWGSVEFLRANEVGDRMDAEGHVHDGTRIAWAGRDSFYVDINKHVESQFMAYGQTEIQKDLYDAGDRIGTEIVFEASDVGIHDVTTGTPYVTYSANGDTMRVDCDYVAACDGYHGVGRPTIPDDVLRSYEKVYPFGWLGILSETPPLPDLVYCNHPRGFALASMRNPMLSRYYVQCSLDDTVEEWPDERFWEELLIRLPEDTRDDVVTGRSIEKSIAPLRSFVAEPMRYGSLFLAGDAAHIVPPTGAKGLNLAISDVYYLSRALIHHYEKADNRYLDNYSDMALRRVWSAVRFSWWLTLLLHRFPDQTDFDQRAQEAELEYLRSSHFAQASMCEQYAGLPFET
jgi:p-hydroxybenzoate 3-monooxygenase